MRLTFLSSVLVFTMALVVPGAARAQPVPPVIHRVTLQPETGVLTIAGTGLGPDLLVALEGQPISVLPGATATQIEALVPAPVLATPGTFRLTVVDLVRQVGDTFVVASQTGRVADGSPVPDRIAGGGSSRAASGVPAAPPVTPALGRTAATVRESVGGPSPLVIEDSGFPYRTSVGSGALFSSTIGTYNTASGVNALYTNTSGGDNTANGAGALFSNTTGSYNTASGRDALVSNTTGIFNTATGAFALRQNLGSWNTATGVSALYNNITGSENTASGFEALVLNTTGSENTASGYRGLYGNTTGTGNTASGAYALFWNTTGNFNTASGRAALWSNTTGIANTAGGWDALSSNTTGNLNTAYGTGALGYNTTGSNSVAVGATAGLDATTGSYNVFLGNGVRGTAVDTNTIRLGLPYDSATGAGQNRTFIAGIRGTAVAAGEAVFIDPAGQLGSGPLPPLAANSVGSAHVIDDALTASDLAPNAVGPSELADNAVTAAKVAFNYAASTSEGGPALDVACTGCVAASEVGFTFASLGANTFTGTQTLAAGHLDLAPSSAAAGNLTKSGALFLHDTGFQNTFLGVNAGNIAVGSGWNTAHGHSALAAVSSGGWNTATGAAALTSNTVGNYNTASGLSALFSNTTGIYNTASGAVALSANTSGNGNNAFGASALYSNTTGSNSVAVGNSAGYYATTGSYNIYLGNNVPGTVADTHTMRLGLPYDIANDTGQNRTFIAGVAGTVLTTPAVQVFVDANGQLGTLVPAPFSGTIDAPVSGWPGQDAARHERLVEDATSRVATLEDIVRRQEAAIAELQRLVGALQRGSARR